MTTQIADIKQDKSKTRAQVLAIGAGNDDHIFRTSDTNEWLFVDNAGTVTDLSNIGNATSIQTIPIDAMTSSIDLKGRAVDGMYRQNQCRRSHDFANSRWTKTAMAINDATGIPSPVEGKDYIGLIGTAVPTTHEMMQACTLFTGDRASLGVYVKTGRLDKVTIRIYDTSTTAYDFRVTIDLSNGSVQARTGIGFSDVRKISDGEYYFVISIDSPTSAYPRVRITPGETWGTDIYTGDGINPDIYIATAHLYNYHPDEKVGYIETVDAINAGVVSFSTDPTFETKIKRVCVGESITYGSALDISYPRRLAQLNPSDEFLNLGQNGATVQDIITSDGGMEPTVQLPSAIGELFFDFVQETSTFPFTAANDAVLSIDTNSLKIARVATVDAAAVIKCINKDQNVPVAGQFAGDGVSNIIIRSVLDGTVLATSTTSATLQDFSFTFRAGASYDGFEFVVNGGASGNFGRVTNLSIADADYRTTKTMFLMSGINSITDGVSSADIIDQLTFIIKHAHIQNISVVMMNIHPIFGAFADGTRQTKVTEVNTWIETLSNANHIVNFDEMGDVGYELLTDWNSGDDLHPNEAGYIKMGNIINIKWALGGLRS